MPDIVLLYGPTWDAPSQMSKQHIARYWARSRRVLYVESPANLMSFYTRREEAVRLWHRYRNGPVEVSKNLWVHTFFYPLSYRRSRIGLGKRWVNDLNQKIVRPRLLQDLNYLGFRRPILFLGSAYALPLIDYVAHTLLVYHCSDDYTLVPSFPPSFVGLEAELIRRCDVVIATAEELRRAKRNLNPNIFTITNGVQVEHFVRTQSPETEVASELVDMPKPVVGYIGSVFRWIDQDMVAFAARQRPNWSFVFVGPIGIDVATLRSCRNVYFLGARPYESLPCYLKGFDVAVVPFVLNELTLRASPIKFYEYLASGVPIVATKLPDFEPFGHLAGLVCTPQEFLDALELAVQDNSSEAKEARMAEAQKHSWEARFRRIDDLLATALRH